MRIAEFFRAWWKATRNVAKTQRGQLQASIIITFFLMIGCFAGSIQEYYAGQGVLGFILFCVGALQIITLSQSVPLYRRLVKEERLFGGVQ